jgi:murein DD-endopeptidase MepM/ murein hydrolase activator NlpD
MTEPLLPATAGEPPHEASSDLNISVPASDATAPAGDDGGQDSATTVDDTAPADTNAPSVATPDATPAPYPPTPEPTSTAGSRVNDAMRVLSRMQTDLDLVTEGKRAATYGEVDTAFQNAVTALGIKVPAGADAALGRFGGGAQNTQYESGPVERLSSTDPMPGQESGYAAAPAPGAPLDMVVGGGGADRDADAPSDAMSWSAATTSLQGAFFAKSAVSAPKKSGKKSGKSGAVLPKVPSAKFTPPLPDERAVTLARDWPVPGYPDPNDHRFPLQGEKDLNGARYADGRYSPEGKYRTQQGKKGLVPRPHRGYDLPGRAGDPIAAAADGVVMGFGVAKGWGTYIAIKHPDGYTTVYAHLSSYAKLKIGQAVTRGTTIGAMGNTGDAKGRGTHLHLEVKVTNEGPNGNMTLARDNRTVDPVEWLAGKLHQP